MQNTPMEANYPYAFGCEELVLYGIRDTVATPRNCPRHRVENPAINTSIRPPDYDYQQEAVQRGRLLLPARALQVPVSVGGPGESAQSPVLLLLLLLGPGQAQHLLLGIFNFLLTAALPCTEPAGTSSSWEIIVYF